MKRILLIGNYQPSVGGISGQMEVLYQCLQKEGIDCTIFSTKGSFFKRLLRFCELLRIARQYDVLHIHGCSEWGFLPIVYGIIVGKIWHKRIIVTYHGGGADEYFARHTRFVKRWFNRANAVIVLNGFLKKVFDKYVISCIVIPNIVEFNEPIQRKNHEGIRFISVRHLRPLYNIPCILEAYRQVRGQYEDCSLTILGQGPQREELEQMVKKLHILDVTFVGQVPNTEIMRYLSESDIMLSAPHIDNMPVSVLEAMNAGVLVISSRVGGVPYIMEEDKTGLFFTDDKAEELAEKMIWAITHPTERERMVQKAQLDVQKYTWKNIKDKISNVYQI